MTHNPHRATPPIWSGQAPERARLGVIVLHGRTQSPAIMDQLVVDHLCLRDVAYVAPTAAGNSWYPGSFLLPRGENEPLLSMALKYVDEISMKLARCGVPRERQVVLGFSQGACLGAEYVYRSGRPLAALIALTGGLVGPPDVTRWDDQPAHLSGMPVLLGGSEEDPFVPAYRMRETAHVFAAHGAYVECKFYPGTAHEIPTDQIERTRALLARLGTEPGDGS